MAEENEFPNTIEGFGYKFNEEGELRNIHTGERFEFVVRPEDRQYNQRHYEELGEVIGEFIENELVKSYNLIKKIIPVGSEEDDNIAKSRIYMSGNAQECQTLLLLIQGSGVVRPGQWARQVIINDSLERGTMFPYIKKAQELEWGIVIFNPNENYGSIIKDGEVSYSHISGSESPPKHCLYVWNNFVKNARAKNVLIVAHSYGGVCTTYLLDHFAEDFYSRVKGIALTDSVHSSGMIPTHSRKWFSKYAFNWIKSYLPINEYIHEANQFYGCKCFSAGHPKHEYTSGVAFETVFEFLQYRSKEKRKDNDEITSQGNETSEKSSIVNNNKDAIDGKDSTIDESLNEETKPQTNNGSNSITHEKSTMNTEDTLPNSVSAMKIDKLPKTTNETIPDKNIEAIGKSQLESDSAMDIDESSKAISEEDTDKSFKATNDTIPDKNIEPIGNSQLDSGSAMEIDESSKTISDKDTDELFKATNKTISEKNVEAIGEPVGTNDPSKATEKDIKVTPEPHLDSGSVMETDDKSPKETNPEKDTPIGEHQPDTTKTGDDAVTNEQTVNELSDVTNEIITEKSQLKDEMNNALVNDDKSHKENVILVKHNNSDNISKEITMDDQVLIHDDNNTKDTSQNNNIETDQRNIPIEMFKTTV
ncbi:protein FAM172A-like [Rhizophagus clarus]|uniref:Protein FAM172A-like n=1 Tax=Rhizophagus clarus TaxID=94130 RepID=A0A8H3M5X7_9GLOM|nr:protein FAM172A-like [Rhizophagus clarus]